MPGPQCHFETHDKNPNPGEGCLCSPNAKVPDCTGPYLLFTHAEVLDPFNPHAVMGSQCARAAARKLGVAKPEPKATVVLAQDDIRDAEMGRLLTECAAVLAGTVKSRAGDAVGGQ